MKLLILNKKNCIVLAFVFLVFQNVYCDSIKKLIDEKKEELQNHSIITEFDLADYLSHVDGMAVVYRDINDIGQSFVQMTFFTSMYQERYDILINHDYLNGYVERVTYKNQYDLIDANYEIVEEFKFKTQEIIKERSKTEKYVNLALTLLSETDE